MNTKKENDKDEDSIETDYANKQLQVEHSDINSMIISLSEADNRETWGGKFDFILSLIGNAVGLGNVWRFPYIVYMNGGGAFLIPYFLMVLLIGISGTLLECSIGQYSAVGTVQGFYNMVPIMKGVGIASLINCIFLTYFYNQIIAWCYYYLGASFSSTLPWSTCHDEYNTERCFSPKEFIACQKNDSNFYINHTCYGLTDNQNSDFMSNLTRWYGDKEHDCVYINSTFCDNSTTAVNSITSLFNLPSKLRVSSAFEYFYHGVLQISDTIEDIGLPPWQLTLCLAVTWLINFLCLARGIKSSGKVVYFTATFPYLIILILLVRSLTLEGSYTGVMYYVKPDWNKLEDIDLWVLAAGQVLFSLSNGLAIMPTLSSYNRFNNNIISDVFFVCIADTITSFVAGFAIFGSLGNLATILGVTVEEVAKKGPGLAFIAYPDLVSNLPPSQLWSVLFFFMLITLGLDTSTALIESINTYIIDTFPTLRPKRTLVVLVVCSSFFLASIILTTPAGDHIIDLVDTYTMFVSLLMVALMENITVAYFYGIRSFVDNLVEMTGLTKLYFTKPIFYLLYCVITPGILVILIGYKFHKTFYVNKGQDLHNKNPSVFPSYVDTIGLVLQFLPFFAILMFGVIVIIQMEGSLRTRFNSSIKSTNGWRKNALRHNKMEKYMKQTRMFRYKSVDGRSIRQKIVQ